MSYPINSAHYVSTFSKMMCPNLQFTFDPRDRFAVMHIMSNLTYALLEHERKVLSPNGIKLLDILDRMLNDNSNYSFERKTAAYTALTTISAYLSQKLDNVPVLASRCLYSQIVDSTVLAMDEKDEVKLMDVFSKVAEAAVENVKFLALMALKWSGCTNPGISLDHRYCENDGKDHRLYGMMRYTRSIFEEDFKKVITLLFFSKDDVENTLAAIAGASMSPAYRYFSKHHTDEFSARIFTIMQVDQLPAKCCEYFPDEVIDALKREETVAENAAVKARKDFVY